MTASTPEAPSSEAVLRIEGLYKSFGDTPVLRGIDLEVDQHQVVVAIGASGSGKSTLLKTINLLEQIDDGRIFLKGEDISDPRIDVDRTRARIGVVFQQFNLFPHLSVLDNVTLASRKVHGIPRDEAEATAVQWLERIGLGAKVKDFPDRLSGGQQQRVAIIRAIVTNPELLLLDEITSALASACARASLRTRRGASITFSSTVRCGNRLNCWNTMPTSARSASPSSGRS